MFLIVPVFLFVINLTAFLVGQVCKVSNCRTVQRLEHLFRFLAINDTKADRRLVTVTEVCRGFPQF